MRIYSMTATFGKLENQTLTLKPGLNIIEAPNEWGKSTWCAFLVAMLYGIDTKAKTTKTALADKEHYAPWSGAPMEGRMDICWKGKDITIERRTKGRLIFGDFRAYETQTGVDVPELNASNCGTELLGVERSVFTRAGFLKMADLPVTQDDALRRRLNNLVTTGDESGAGEKLAQALKDLKNKCRYNRSGLLPQAEAEAERLDEQIRTVQDLNAQAQRLRQRQQELEEQVKLLQNHKTALNYAQAQQDTQHIQEALAAGEQAKLLVEQLETACRELPSEEEAERVKANLQRLHNESMSLQMEQQMLPKAPEQPVPPQYFAGMTGDEALKQAGEDSKAMLSLTASQKGKTALKTVGLAGMVLGATLAGAYFLLPMIAMVLAGGGLVAIGLILLFVGIAQTGKCAKKIRTLQERYGQLPQTSWEEKAEEYAEIFRQYQQQQEDYNQMADELERRRENLAEQLQSCTQGETAAASLEKWDAILTKWRELADARRDYQRAEGQVAALRAMSKEVPTPEFPDKLTQPMIETDALLNNASFEQKQNQLRIGQYQGQADALGQESDLRARLKRVKTRINNLEDTYLALELAQKALSTATSELQRRFAPRISKRAQELFTQLTDGRYQRIMLEEDLSVNAATGQEATLRSAQWRSDGTIDQLYLALRLAVAEELTPEAPLVLDDAMVRFDDKRLTIALDILKEMAENKQVILFTCQGRELKLQGEKQ